MKQWGNFRLYILVIPACQHWSELKIPLQRKQLLHTRNISVYVCVCIVAMAACSKDGGHTTGIWYTPIPTWHTHLWQTGYEICIHTHLARISSRVFRIPSDAITVHNLLCNTLLQHGWRQRKARCLWALLHTYIHMHHQHTYTDIHYYTTGLHL